LVKTMLLELNVSWVKSFSFCFLSMTDTPDYFFKRQTALNIL
jgi:hypothetical protein